MSLAAALVVGLLVVAWGTLIVAVLRELVPFLRRRR